MKPSLIVFMSVLMLFGAPAVRAQVQHEIALTRADIQTERQALVAENLPLTEDQAKAFWPMYRTYREEVAKRVYEQSLKGRAVYIPGRLNVLLRRLSQVIPEETKARILGRRWERATELMRN